LLSAVHAAVPSELQTRVRANTFEVVMRKPDHDTATYEKALPLDLIPFHERNDAFQSIGTAFALGHDTYVTAGHVLEACIESQYGAPALRGSDGKTYAIDLIRRFSLREDYVVFSVNHGPDTNGFSVDREPKLDDPVLAVGNALGEGVVIREGLYTSATEEDQDGQWKWIRFSAAASPGNSGGPLLDANGSVIGLVIGKSPNENLNFALPIERVLNGDLHRAKFELRTLTALPYFRGTQTYAFSDGFDLPLPWTAFVESFQALMARHDEEAIAQLLKTYADSMFPRGPGSESLLFGRDANGFNPALIMQDPDGNWVLGVDAFKVTNLPGDGSVGVSTIPGATLLRLVRPNNAADDAFYGDTKAFMDLALKALNLRRSVGQDPVRITSLGAAAVDAQFTDTVGRKWQERVWAVPFLNLYVIGLLMPTPDGYVAVIEYAPSAQLRTARNRIRLYAAQVSVSLRGTIRQWQAYLRRRDQLPDKFRDVKLDQSPDWTFRTARFSSSVPPAALRLTDESPLMLTMGFSANAALSDWDVQEVWWNQDERLDAAIGVWRRERPTSGANLELRNAFARMHDRQSPYDGSVVRDTAESYSMSRIVEVPGKAAGKKSADLLYGVTLRFAGPPTDQKTAQSLDRAILATQVLEHGVGVDEAGATGVAPSSVPTGKSNASLADFVRALTEYAGKDIRGHTFTEDFIAFGAAWGIDVSDETRLNSADVSQVQKQQFLALTNYWNHYPSLTHNRDLWASFLARNALPPATLHDSAVMAAEASLLAALNSAAPDDTWSSQARELNAAYIKERERMVRQVQLPAVFRDRVSPCPAAAERTSGKSTPAIARMNRSLEDFWPAESRRLGEEGTVMLRVRIAATGCALSAAIVGSSGSDMLDDAVMRFVETIDFQPAEIDGKAIETTVTQPIVFKLKN
jgi:TonB family protein